MRPMIFPALFAGLASLVLTAAPAAPAEAGPRQAASLGQAALARGDDQAAIRQLTQFLLYGGGTGAEREQAYVRRARAYLVLGRDGDALIDARAALALSPGEAEAIAIRDRAAALAAPTVLAGRPIGDASDPLNAQVLAKAQAVAARNRAAFAAHLAEEAQYEAAKARITASAKAADAVYAAAIAARQAQIDAIDQQHAAAMADWQARVKACKAGDRTQCAKPAAKGG